MKLLCTLLLVCCLQVIDTWQTQTDQYLLFNGKRERVGSLAIVDKTAYLKMDGTPVETLYIVFVTKRGEQTFYYMGNDKAEGYIMIDCCTVICEFMLWRGRDRYYEVFYRIKPVK